VCGLRLLNPLPPFLMFSIVNRLGHAVNYAQLELTDVAMWASVATCCDILMILVVNCVKRKKIDGF
jgi:hypothetical protein